jgi:hypothetical protein
VPPSSAAFGNDVTLSIQVSGIVQVVGRSTSRFVEAVDRFESAEVLRVSDVCLIVQAGGTEGKHAIFVLEVDDLSDDGGRERTREVNALHFSTEVRIC